MIRKKVPVSTWTKGIIKNRLARISGCTQTYDGFQHVREYSKLFTELITSVAMLCEKKIFREKKMRGMGIFLFGSPSRQEMVSDSDADILIIREENVERFSEFKEEFMRELQKYDFSKIDIPDWGTIKDCEQYAECSITEGNQVLESRFIYGDPLIAQKVEQIKKRYCTINKFERVIVFQKFYFDQYYKQKMRVGGIKNIKYGHGGTRDFLFANWFSSLIEQKQTFTTKEPLIKESILTLYKHNLISNQECKKYLQSCAIVTVLRNEVLVNNNGTTDEGLTYLDERSLKLLLHSKIFPEIHKVENLRNFCSKHMNEVKQLKLKIWALFKDYLEKERGKKWIDDFNAMEKGDISNYGRIVESSDVIKQVCLIWSLNRKKHERFFRIVLKKLSNSRDWEVLCSICCHQDCPEDILDKIATHQGFEKGYEYILRITARNKNTSIQTLKKIAENKNLEERYRIVAMTACARGVEKANEFP